MRLIGWCTRCRRVKQVTTRIYGRGIPSGICAACEEAIRDEQTRRSHG